MEMENPDFEAQKSKIKIVKPAPASSLGGASQGDGFELGRTERILLIVSYVASAVVFAVVWFHWPGAR